MNFTGDKEMCAELQRNIFSVLQNRIRIIYEKADLLHHGRY